MIWALIALTILSHALLNILTSRASLAVNSLLTSSVINTVGALIPIGVYLMVVRNSGINVSTNKGISIAVMAGACLAIFTLSLTKIFSLGSNLSYVMPLIFGGSIVLSIIAGIVVFKEKVMMIELVGAGLILAGITAIVWSRIKGVALV